MLADNLQNNFLNGNEIWHGALEVLRHEYGDSTFRSWFSQMTYAELNGDKLTLTVPSRFIKEWIEYNYSQAIIKALSSFNQSITAIEIKIKSPRAQITDASVSKAADAANDSKSPARDDSKCDILDFDLDPRFTFENFAVGKSNRIAYNAAQSIASGEELPSKCNILYVQSPVGMGKTHLLQAIARDLRKNKPALKIAYLSADKFMHLYISAIKRNDLTSLQAKLRSLDVLLIDDLQFICGKNATQQELGQTFSQLTEANKKVIVSCDTNPYNLNLDPRTKSRLAGGLCVNIKPAEFELQLDILRLKTKLLGANISEDVLKYIAHKIISSVRELEGALSKLIYIAQIEGVEIDVKYAQEHLKDSLAANERTATVDQVIDYVAEYFSLTPSEIRTKSRAKRYSMPRQIAAYIAKGMTTKSFQEIGFKLGGKDHATVIYSIKKLEQKLGEDKKFADEFARIMDYVGERSLRVI